MGKKGRRKGKNSASDGSLSQQQWKEEAVICRSIIEITTAELPLTPVKQWKEHLKLRSLVEKIRAKQEGRTVTGGNDIREGKFPAFVQWFKENGGDSNAVQIYKFEREGYGLMATRDIKAQELVVSVPSKLMMTLQTAEASKLGPLIAEDRILRVMPNVALALHVLCEKYDEESFWAPYLEILPPSYSTPLYFKPEELQLLQGSPAFDVSTPGPGTYDIPSTIGTAVAMSIRGRYPPIPTTPSPSPNTYSIVSDTNKTKFSLTYRPFESQAPNIPGPAHYQPNTQYLSTTKNSPKCHCAPKRKLHSFALLASPERDELMNSAVGPGTYEVKARNDSPAYSMGKRISRCSDLITPGPGEYNVTSALGRSHNRKAPAFSMGRRLHEKLETIGPGPAGYFVKPKQSRAHKQSVAGPNRQQKASLTPSPNEYNIQQGQTRHGRFTGPQASLKGRASPYLYSGFSDPKRVCAVEIGSE